MILNRRKLLFYKEHIQNGGPLDAGPPFVLI